MEREDAIFGGVKSKTDRVKKRHVSRNATSRDLNICIFDSVFDVWIRGDENG